MTEDVKKARCEALRAACPSLDIGVAPGQLREYGTDWTRFHAPDPAAVVFPRQAGEVRQLVMAAAELGIPLVPSGGRTGLSGGAVATAGEVVVSFEKMRRIIGFDPVDRTLTVEAGVTTAEIQAAAAARGLYYPVSFASEGSSQIGGNIATNAGGVRVLRYGLTRDRVAGLRVVDGRGRLHEFGSGLVKDASGYDLRHLMIGSEGTLGLIVEATLWLTDPPPGSKVMLLAVPRLEDLLQVLAHVRGQLTLSAFEFFSEPALGLVCSARGLRRPFEEATAYYALLEFDCAAGDEERMDSVAHAAFAGCRERGWATDGVISQNEAQAAGMWRYREGIAEATNETAPYKNDLSVRLSRMPGYLAELDALVAGLFPGFEVLWYGHIGDGNLHMNVLRPDDMDRKAFEEFCAGLGERIYEVTRKHGGSVSAEHGIGLHKVPYLGFRRSADEIEMMRGIKQVFDPAGILNPGKLLE